MILPSVNSYILLRSISLMLLLSNYQSWISKLGRPEHYETIIPDLAGSVHNRMPRRGTGKGYKVPCELLLAQGYLCFRGKTWWSYGIFIASEIAGEKIKIFSNVHLPILLPISNLECSGKPHSRMRTVRQIQQWGVHGLSREKWHLPEWTRNQGWVSSSD